MTTTTIRVMNCDHAGCDAYTEDDNPNGLYRQQRANGWTDAIYTHGCPDHGYAIAAHRADITSDTRGRGRTERTTWYLRCACGWRPSPNFQAHSASWLREQHVAHVAEATAAPDVEPWDDWPICPACSMRYPAQQLLDAHFSRDPECARFAPKEPA